MSPMSSRKSSGRLLVVEPVVHEPVMNAPIVGLPVPRDQPQIFYAVDIVASIDLYTAHI